jgi:hypothetical protein
VDIVCFWRLLDDFNAQISFFGFCFGFGFGFGSSFSFSVFFSLFFSFLFLCFLVLFSAEMGLYCCINVISDCVFVDNNDDGAVCL